MERPYYFTYEAEKLGYHSQIILAGRKVNDGMGAYVADAAVKSLIKAGKAPKRSKVVILGLTFKENCPDVRNSKVMDIVERLREYEIAPLVSDPWADKDEAKRFYNVDLVPLENTSDADCVIVAVAHAEFTSLGLDGVMGLFADSPASEKILVDVKGIYPVSELRRAGVSYWRL